MGRNAQRRSRPTPAPAVSTTDFFARLHEQLGAEVSGLADALATPSPVSIRVNTAKWSGPNADPVPWCSNGHYLGERPSFTFDPLLHAGAYYVQEASSMLLEQAVKASGLAHERIVALDLCAAPGGKSTHLRSLLHADALLVSNEIDRKRQLILQENLWKWGATNTVITGAAPQRFARLPAFFDLVVVDAPCSGEGMFRKDPFAREQWNPELVRQCSAMQHDALDHAWASLKPGGILIYSTCTWEIEENEAQIARLVEQGGSTITIPVADAWGMLRSHHATVDALRCYPHRVRGEGFFMAVVRKNGERNAMHMCAERTTESPGSALTWLKPTRAWRTLEQGDELFAVDGTWSIALDHLRGVLPVLSPGIPLGERKAGEWRPHQALALAQDLDIQRFPRVELDYDAAINYLRGQAIAATDAHGTALAMYRSTPLGWLQGAGNRWNNRWPAPWRIRAQGPSAPLVSWSLAR